MRHNFDKWAIHSLLAYYLIPGKSSGISISVAFAGHSFSGTHLFKSGKCGSEGKFQDI